MKKVFVLPPELYESLKRGSNQVPEPSSLHDPKKEKILRLEQELKGVLESNSTYDEKRMLYQQVLQRLLSEVEGYRVGLEGKDQSQNPVFPDRENAASSDMETHVTRSLPSSLKQKGLILYNTLKERPGISWNPMGEIIIDGSVIQGSNVVDLVGDLVRKWERPPVQGWGIIKNKLKSSNFPKSVIINPHRLTDLEGGPLSETPRGRKPTRNIKPYPTARKLRKSAAAGRAWLRY